MKSKNFFQLLLLLTLLLMLFFSCTAPGVDNDISSQNIFGDSRVESLLTSSSSQIIGTPVPALVNVALGKKAFASSEKGRDYVAINAVDANYRTMWVSQTSYQPEWFYIDLGKVYPVKALRIFWSSDFAVRYGIYISKDAYEWTNVYEEYNGNGGLDELKAAQAVGIRYIGIYCLKGESGAYGFSEFEVLGYDSTTPTPSPTPIIPKLIIDFRDRLQLALGKGYKVDVAVSAIDVYPTQYIVDVMSLTDNLMPGDFSKGTFNIHILKEKVEIISHSVKTVYVKVEIPPEGLLLYEGMILWLKQQPQSIIEDIDPIVLMTKIYNLKTEKPDIIYFTDPNGTSYILYRQLGEIILKPIKI